MSIPDQSAFRKWLIEYFSDQIKARAMTREEAVEHIRAAADRVTQAGSQNAEKAEAVARAMIVALPKSPENDRAG